MTTQIFITLPVEDVPRSLAFYKALGFSDNPQFSDGTGTSGCIVVSDHISIMLAAHERFRELAPKDICDTSKALEVLHALTCDSREQVDEIVRRAIAAGGTTIEEAQDYGFMYHHGFVDLDGHCWGLNHMIDIPSA